MTTFTYKITRIMVYSNQRASNIVGEATLEIEGTLNGKTQKSFFPVYFDNPDYNNFIQYDNLTEQEIITWAVSKFGQEQIDSIKEGLQSMLDFVPPADAPPILKPIDPPWVNSSVS
jgi:hypothetical protein